MRTRDRRKLDLLKVSSLAATSPRVTAGAKPVQRISSKVAIRIRVRASRKRKNRRTSQPNAALCLALPKASQRTRNKQRNQAKQGRKLILVARSAQKAASKPKTKEARQRKGKKVEALVEASGGAPSYLLCSVRFVFWPVSVSLSLSYYKARPGPMASRQLGFGPKIASLGQPLCARWALIAADGWLQAAAPGREIRYIQGATKHPGSLPSGSQKHDACSWCSVLT